MSAMSNYLESALVNHVLRNTSYTSPITIYAALFTSDPTDADIGTEVSGGSYARTTVSFSTPSDGATENSSTVTFTQATADWGTVTHFGLYDASTGGNLLIHGALDAAKVVNTNDTFSFQAGDLDIVFS